MFILIWGCCQKCFPVKVKRLTVAGFQPAGRQSWDPSARQHTHPPASRTPTHTLLLYTLPETHRCCKAAARQEVKQLDAASRRGCSSCGGQRSAPSSERRLPVRWGTHADPELPGRLLITLQRLHFKHIYILDLTQPASFILVVLIYFSSIFVMFRNSVLFKN